MVHRGRTRTMAVAVTASLLLVATGCGKAADKMAQKAGEKMIESAAGEGVDVDLGKDGNMQVKTEDGSFSMSGEDGSFNMEMEDGSFSSQAGEIPSSWPDDLPLPSKIEVEMGTEMMDADGGATVMVSAITPVSVEELKAFYAEALSEWDETYSSSSSSDGMSYVQVGYAKNDRSVMIMLSEVDGASQINVTHTLEIDG